MTRSFFLPVASSRHVVWLSGLLSAAFLAFALISQYGFGLFPCELCLAQRVPYAAIIVLAALALVLKRPRLHDRMAMLCVLLFAANAGIAAYHAGVEAHVFPGPSACTASTEEQTLEEMRQAILNAELVACDQPMAHFLGLSMASWNAIVALASAVMAYLGLRHARKRARAS